jgi:hypothetical protein
MVTVVVGALDRFFVGTSSDGSNSDVDVVVGAAMAREMRLAATTARLVERRIVFGWVMLWEVKKRR